LILLSIGWLFLQLPPQFQDLGKLETRDLRLVRRHGQTWVVIRSPFRAEGERFVLEARGAQFPEGEGISRIGGEVVLRQDSLQTRSDSLYLLPGQDPPLLFVGHVKLTRSRDTVMAGCVRYTRERSWLDGGVQVRGGDEQRMVARAQRAIWVQDTLTLLPYPVPLLILQDTPSLRLLADTLRLMNGALQALGEVELWHVRGTGDGKRLDYRTETRKGVLLGEPARFVGVRYRMEADTLRFELDVRSLKQLQGIGDVHIQTEADSLTLEADRVRIEWTEDGEVRQMEARGGVSGWLKTSSP
jgi:hypothetical protein